MAKSGYKVKIVEAYFREVGLPAPTFEHTFAPPRKWRFDIAWPAWGVALEVEGGVFTGGRHSRGAGMVKDMEKYNTAAIHGWTVLRCMPTTLCMNETVTMVDAALKMRGCE